MPATTPLGIPYLVPGDQADIAGSEQNLATSVDGLFGARSYPVAARQLLRASSLTAGAGQENPVGGYDSTGYNVGGITYAGGVMTVPAAGLYQWAAQVTLASGSGRVFVGVLLNGAASSSVDGDEGIVLTSSGSLNSTAGGPISLSAGASLQMSIYIPSGGNSLSVTPTRFTLWRIA